MQMQTGQTAFQMNHICQHDIMYIEQQRKGRECLEAMTGCEMANKFWVRLGGEGGPIFMTAIENSDFCERQCCSAKLASFEINLYPGTSELGTPLLQLKRGLKCTDTTNMCPCCCLCDCQQHMTINDTSGNQIGYIKEESGTTCFSGTMGVYRSDPQNPEAEGVRIAAVKTSCGAMCSMCCCKDVNFPIVGGDLADGPQSADGTVDFGMMTRKWVCKCFDLAADIDHMEITMTKATLTGQATDELDRILLMGAGILIKYVFFEQNQQ